MAETDAEQIARNDAIFRTANEEIHDRAQAFEVRDWVPFLCECADPACTEVVRIPLEEYERIRAEPTWFLYSAGHVARPPHADAAALVEQHPGYEIVAKDDRT